MNKMQLRAKIENHAMLITKYNLTSNNALELQKVAKSLHRLNENACNYGLTDRQETRQRNLFTKAIDILSQPFECASVFIHIREQRDPRGWPLEVSLEPMTDSQTYDYVCPF